MRLLLSIYLQTLEDWSTLGSHGEAPCDVTDRLTVQVCLRNQMRQTLPAMTSLVPNQPQKANLELFKQLLLVNRLHLWVDSNDALKEHGQ